jgi:hypothetical protein
MITNGRIKESDASLLEQEKSAYFAELTDHRHDCSLKQVSPSLI